MFRTFVCGHADMIVSLLKENGIHAWKKDVEALTDKFFPDVIVKEDDSKKAWEILKSNGFL